MRACILLFALVAWAVMPAVEFPIQGKALSGEAVVLDPVRAQRPLVLVFWASWCGACVREMPHLRRYHAVLGDRAQIVSCSIDQDMAAAKSAASTNALPYIVLQDPEMAIATRFAVEMTPTLILIDSDGKERARGRSLGQLRQGLVGLGLPNP